MEGSRNDIYNRQRQANTAKTLVSRRLLQENTDLTDFISSQKLSPPQSAPYFNPDYKQDGITTRQIEQKYYLLSPQLYESYRNETCQQQIISQNFKILRFSGGRNELHFANLCEIELPGVVKLTLWNNGDYKLILGSEQIYFWHQEQRVLDKYCQSI